jgi:hypothetical protein
MWQLDLDLMSFPVRWRCIRWTATGRCKIGAHRIALRPCHRLHVVAYQVDQEAPRCVGPTFGCASKEYPRQGSARAGRLAKHPGDHEIVIVTINLGVENDPAIGGNRKTNGDGLVNFDDGPTLAIREPVKVD